MEKLYFGLLCNINAVEKVMANGIPEPEKGEANLLSFDFNGAIASALLDTSEDEAKQLYFKATGIIYVFTVEMPESAVVWDIKSRVPEMKDYRFIGYPQAIPPEWITDCKEVDLTEE